MINLFRSAKPQNAELLEKISAIFDNIGNGDFTQEIHFTQDEIKLHGELIDRSISAVQNIQDVTQQLDIISNGDYTADIKPRSDQDKLGIALQRMTEILRNVSQVAEKLAEGDTSVTVKEQGDQDLLAQSMNKMVQTINETAEQANVISNGDYTANIKPRSDQDKLGIALQRMTEILRNVSQVAEKLAEGDTSVTVKVQGASDLLANSVNTMVSKLRLISAENARQIWLANGISGINDTTRGQFEMRKMATSVCQFLAKYLEAQILTFYVLEEEKLHLMGSYAFNKCKNLAETIDIGEGLVGQSALEKEIISVTDIPENYTRIHSSIGDATPRNIVVSPFVIGGTLFGVIEIGSFKELSDDKLTLLGSLEEPIGVVIRSILEQANTKRILEQKIETEKKNRQVEIKAEELTISSKYKSEFLANMSHELRTPLNSMLLLSNSLSKNKEGNLTKQQIEHSSIIHKGGQDLLNLINDILDLSKIEAGMIEVEIKPFSIQDLTKSILLNFKHMMEEKGLEFLITVAPELPHSMTTDQKRLEQILKNLLSNAFKFTKTGSIQVDFSRPGDDVIFFNTEFDPAKSIAISVTDTGIGIPEDRQKVVFEAFQQVDGSTTRLYGGTGLGLSISREMAMLLGGEIKLKSEIEKGTTFTLYLPLELDINTPLAETNTPIEGQTTPSRITLSKKDYLIKDDRDELDEQKPEQGQLKNKKSILLFIEDDPAFAKILLDMCHEQGFVALTTSNGEEGLNLVDQYRPDGIVLDINLPGINGWKVLNALKDNPKTRHIPVHIMSVVDDEKENALARGAIGFINKPVNQDKILDVFQQFQKHSDKKMKDLLVIEDDEATQQGIRELMGNGDVKITKVLNGNDGFQALMTGNFDCVILDLGLPDLSGFELLEKCEQEKNLQLPPVIVYTSKDLSKKEVQQLRKYSDTIIVKGLDPESRLLDETALFLHRVVDNLSDDKRKMIHDLYDVEKLFNNKKVMIVDDDMRNVIALSHILTEKGINIITAEDGQVALDLLKTEKDIDLILMDIMMPIMNGYEATRKIRKQKQFNNLPIIALTAKAMTDDRHKCITAGANDYLSKPVDEQRLFSMLRIWLYQ